MNKEKIDFKNDIGEKLVGDIYLPNSKLNAGVVFGHCFSCSRHTRILTESCEALYRAGIASLKFDFSGNGQSEGEFSETTYSKHVSEMKVAVDQLIQQGISQIGLAGHSMGAAIALLTAASTSNVRGVCTLAGRYSGMSFDRLLNGSTQNQLEEDGQVCFTSRNRSLCLNADFFTDVNSYDLAEITRGLTNSLLAVHGGRDEIIPVEEVYLSRDFRPENTEVFVVEDADHMFSNGEHREVVAERLSYWFSKQFAKSG